MAQRESPTKRVYLIGAGVVAALLAVSAVLAIHALSTPATAPQMPSVVALPGDDPTPVERFAREQGQAAAGAVSGATQPAPDTGSPVAAEASSLQALLPIALPGGFMRTVMTSTSSGAAGLGPASAEATYKRGDAVLHVTVADMGPLGGATSVTGASITTIGGRTMVEDANPGAGTAKYAIIGRRGAVLTAEASAGASLEDAKAALTTIGIDRLEILAAQ